MDLSWATASAGGVVVSLSAALIAFCAGCGAEPVPPQSTGVRPQSQTSGSSHWVGALPMGPVGKGNLQGPAAPTASSAATAATPKPDPPKLVCKARPGYRALLTAKGAEFSTDEKALAAGVTKVRGVIAKWHRDHQSSSCSITHNDGTLVSFYCDSSYVNADGSGRIGENISFTFRRVENDLVRVPAADLVPGNCGARAHLAGHVQLTPPENTANAGLGFVSASWGKNDRVALPRLVATDARGRAAAKAIHAALDQALAPLEHEPLEYFASCEIELSTIETFSLSCDAALEDDGIFGEGLSFRLSGPPYRITSADLFARRTGAARAISRRCAAPYLKVPKDKYTRYLDAVPKLTNADLSSFALGPKNVTFHLHMPFKTVGSNKVRTEFRQCEIPYSVLNTSPARLGRKPVQPSG